MLQQLQTFFAPDHDPSLILGPTSLRHISDLYSSHNRSLDALITNIQLIYMKHFSIDPLTTFFYSTPELTPSTRPLFEEAFTRVLSLDPEFLQVPPIEGGAEKKGSNPKQKATTTPAEPEQIIANLLIEINVSRRAIHTSYQSIKLAFGLSHTIQVFLTGQNTRGVGWDLEGGLVEVFIAYLNAASVSESGGKSKRGKGRGEGGGEDKVFSVTVDRWTRQLGMFIRKLNGTQLKGLLGAIQAFFESAPLMESSGDGGEGVDEPDKLNKQLAQDRKEIAEFVKLLQPPDLQQEDIVAYGKALAEWVDIFVRCVPPALSLVQSPPSPQYLRTTRCASRYWSPGTPSLDWNLSLYGRSGIQEKPLSLSRFGFSPRFNLCTRR